MISWSWRRVKVVPQDILGAAQSLTLGSSRYEIDLIPHWTSSTVYLGWTHECLALDTALHWDAALCYAKRAVCRDIDAFMTCNHLGSFLRETYPRKIEMLSQVGLYIPDIVYELIIDPRNDIEHSYKEPTFQQAKRAVQVAELFLKATADEREHHAIISIGWSISIHEERRSTPEREYERIEFTLTPQNAPMLLIDVCVDNHQVMIIHPKDEEVVACPLHEFQRDEAIVLAKMLRKYYTFHNAGSWRKLKCDWLNKLKADIGL